MSPIVEDFNYGGYDVQIDEDGYFWIDTGKDRLVISNSKGKSSKKAIEDAKSSIDTFNTLTHKLGKSAEITMPVAVFYNDGEIAQFKSEKEMKTWEKSAKPTIHHIIYKD